MIKPISPENMTSQTNSVNLDVMTTGCHGIEAKISSAIKQLGLELNFISQTRQKAPFSGLPVTRLEFGIDSADNNFDYEQLVDNINELNIDGEFHLHVT